MSRLHEHLLNIVTRKPEDYDSFGDGRYTDDDSQPDCSCGCKWNLILEGGVGYDWGVCANPASHRAGLLTFEHQGCQNFEPYRPSNDDLDKELEAER